PLPVPGIDRVVAGYALREGFDPFGTSILEFEAARDGSRAFESLGLSAPRTLTLTGAGEPERLRVAAITSGFLDALGVAPAAGRLISAADDRPNAAPVAILSYGLWRRRF